MAKNNIQNITANGSWQELTGIPNDCRFISLQARTSAAMQYRWKSQSTFWTIKADTHRTLEGRFNNGDLFVMAANGVVIEVEVSTSGVPGI